MKNKNCSNAQSNYPKVKLAIGITSMIFALVMALESKYIICACDLLTFFSSLFDKKLNYYFYLATCFGLLCAFFMLIAGVINIATRNSDKKGGSIAAIIFYLFSILSSILFSLMIYRILSNNYFAFMCSWLFVGFSFGLLDLFIVYDKIK